MKTLCSIYSHYTKCRYAKYLCAGFAVALLGTAGYVDALTWTSGFITTPYTDPPPLVYDYAYYTDLRMTLNGQPLGVNVGGSGSTLVIVNSRNKLLSTFYQGNSFSPNTTTGNGFLGGTLEIRGSSTQDGLNPEAITLTGFNALGAVGNLRFMNLPSHALVTNATLILNDVTLNKYATVNGHGSVISLNSQAANLTIGRTGDTKSVTTFSNNIANTSYYGTIYTVGGNAANPLGGSVTFNNKVVFDKNTAGVGSAIYIANGQVKNTDGSWRDVVVFNEDATFTGNNSSNNTATTGYGTIYIAGAGTGAAATGGSVVFMKDATFTGNSAARGTAVYIHNGGNLVFGGNATFTNNIATGVGYNSTATNGYGTVIHAGGEGNVTFGGKASFVGNLRNYTGSTVPVGTTPYRKNGGVLYTNTGTTTFNGEAEFIGNICTTYTTGGGTTRVADATTSEGIVALNVGGDIYFNDTVKFDGNKFLGSGVNATGAALRTVKGEFAFAKQATFTNNVAQLYVRGEPVATTYAEPQRDTQAGRTSIITAINTAGAVGVYTAGIYNGDEQRLSYGAAIMAEGTNRLSADQGASFQFDGGVLFQGNQTLQYVVGNNSGTIGSDGNTASRGGAIYLRAGEMNFQSDSETYKNQQFLFYNNTTTGRGGAVYLRDAYFCINTRMNIEDGKLIGHDGLTPYASRFEFVNNQSVFGGGAIYAYQGYMLIEGEGLFAGNRAGQRGGAIFLQDNTNTVQEQPHLYLGATTGDIVFTNNKGGVTDIYEYDITGKKTGKWDIAQRMVVASGNNSVIDNPYYIDAAGNKVPIVYETGYTASNFANDITGNGAVLTLNAYKGDLFDEEGDYVRTVNNTIWLDGGIWQYPLNASGNTHGGDMDKIGEGTLAFVGKDVWSFAIGTTSVVQGQFLLGADSLWGKRAVGTEVDAYSHLSFPLNSTPVKYLPGYSLFGTDRDTALHSSTGVGTFKTIQTGDLYNVSYGDGTTRELTASAIALVYEMNNAGPNVPTDYRNGQSNGSGYNAAIFCNDAVIADDTQFRFVVGTNGLLTVNNQGYRDAVMSDDFWKVGYFYDLIHANTAAVSGVTRPMDITLGLDRGAFKNDTSVPGRENIKFREFVYQGTSNPGRHVDSLNNYNVETYAPAVTGLFADSLNVYALTLYRDFTHFEPFEPNIPYYDPSVRNSVLSSRLARFYYPEIVCDPCIENTCETTCGSNVFGTDERQYQSLTSTSNHWETWGEGYGSTGNIAGSNTTPSLDYDGGGMLMGIDRVRKSGNRVGLFYGYGQTQTNATYSVVRDKEHTLGAYTFIKNHRGHVLVSAYVGYVDYSEARRTIHGSTLLTDYLKANFAGFTHGVYLEKGFFDMWVGNRTRLTPFGALQYASMTTDWFDETAVTNSNDIAQTLKYEFSSLRSLLGVRSNTKLSKRLLWRNSFHWEHELLDGDRMVVDVRLKNLPHGAPSYYAVTHKRGVYDGGSNWCDLGTQMCLSATKKLTLNAGYDLRFNSGSTIHTGMAGMRYAF